MLASASVLKTRSLPYLRCNPAVALKTPPFPLTCLRLSSRLASATSSPKTVMLLVARHLVGKDQRHHFNHGLWRAVQLGFRFEHGGRGIYVRREHVHSNRIDGRLFCGQRLVSGLADFIVDFRFQTLNLLLIEDAFRTRKSASLKSDHGAPLLRVPRRTYKFFVIGKRMRIGARNVRMDQRGAAAGRGSTAPLPCNGVALDGIGAVAFRHVAAGKPSHKFRDAPAGRLNFHRHGDGVAVVFHQVEKRKLLATRDVQGFPELALAGRTFSARNIDDFFALVIDVSPSGAFFAWVSAFGRPS